MTYIITFTLSIMISFIYEHRSNRRKGDLQGTVLLFLLVIILSLVAGCRSPQLGTDNIVYYDTFKVACNSDLNTVLLFNQSKLESFETGFMILVWVISRLGDSFFWFCFITSLITNSLFIIGMKYYEDRYSFTLEVICYLFLFYCPFINYVRQGVALGICFFAWRYVDSKKWLKYLLLIILASTIHIGSIISLPIYYILSRNKDIKFDKKTVLIILGVLAVVVGGPKLMASALEYASGLGIRSWTLQKYARRFLEWGRYSFIPTHLLQVLPQLVLATLVYRKHINKDRTFVSLYLMIIIQFMFILMGSVYQNFSRIGLFYGIANILMIPELTKSVKNSEILVLAYGFAYWMFFSVFNHYGFSSAVYPYISSF